jgi:hypothetical protein
MDAQSSRPLFLLVMLFVSPIFLIISTLGFRSGWAEGTLTLVDATARNGLVGDIQVHLGWYNGTVIMSTPWTVIELDVKGAQGWGALVISLCFVCLCGGLFVAYHQEQGTGVNISSKVCKWIIRGGGVTVMFPSFFSFALLIQPTRRYRRSSSPLESRTGPSGLTLGSSSSLLFAVAHQC